MISHTMSPKNVKVFHVRNLEGQNQPGHTVTKTVVVLILTFLVCRLSYAPYLPTRNHLKYYINQVLS